MPKKYMEQDQISGPTPQKRFSLWLIATIVLAALLIAGGVVFAWQRSTNNKAKNDLQGQINTLQSQAQQLTQITPTDKTSNCVKEGEAIKEDYIGKYGSIPSGVCCAGLTPIKDSTSSKPLTEGGCSGAGSDSYACAACGNGVCGTGENECNCPTDCKTADVTADWKIYTNSKFSYTVKYPSNWFYKDYNDVTIDNVLLSRVVFSGKALPSDIGKMDPMQSISVWVENRPFAEEHAAFLQELHGPLSETTTTIDGVQATKLSGLIKAVKYPSVEVIIPKDGKLYTIVGIASPLISTVFDQMLSTFKFTK